MKTNHIKWEDMWERDFANYVGWTVNSAGNKHLRLSDDFEDNSDNSKNKSDNFQNSFDAFQSSSGQYKWDGIQYKSNDNNSLDNLYPVDSYIESIPSATQYFDSMKEETKEPAKEDKEESKFNPLKGKDCCKLEKQDSRTQTFAPICSRPADIISEASTGQGFTFVSEKEEVMTYLPFNFCIAKTLGITAIDTSSLKRPKTKVTFSCNIYFVPRDIKGIARLEFLLYSTCNFGSESLVGNWSYEIIDKGECLSQPFKFCFLSQYSFPGRYNYYARVIPVYIKGCCVSITGCQLNAIAQSG